MQTLSVWRAAGLLIATLPLAFARPAAAYCWTGSAPGLVSELQREVERDPTSALRRANQELARLQGGQQDSERAAWLYAIQAAANYQLNGSETVKAAAEKGLQLLSGRHGPAEPDLRLAVLNSMNTPEGMQRSIGQYDAAERAAASAQARICIMIQRGLARSDLMQVQGALIDLTSAYVQSKSLPATQEPLKAFSATALASVLSRRGLLDIASPLFEEALATYKREGFTFDVLTTYVRQGLAKSADGQAAEAIKDFRSLLASPRIDLMSEDILAVVQANLCQSHTRMGNLGSADQACTAAERLLHNTQAPTWYLVYSARADLALRRHQPDQALALLDKASRWRFGAPLARDLDTRARAYAALGQPAKAVPLLTDYVDLVRKQDREDRSFFADAWRARVFALEKEAERLQLSRSLALSRERSDAQRKRIAIILVASTAIILLLMAIVLITRRARAKTILLTEEIQQQARDKIRMIAHISHEIRSPLGSMTLVAKALSSREETSGDVKRLLSRMDRNGERIARLLADMLDYSRIEAGQLSLKFSNAELRPLLEEVVEPHRLDASQKGIDLSLTVSDEVPQSVWCDGQRLFQVLDNLIANAVRFTDAGGVTLQATMSAEADALVLSVEDTGIGIPSDQLEKLFSEYRQVQSERHDRGGTGLGLVISRTLTEAMGGSLKLAARPEGGLVAYVAMPLEVKVAV